LTGGAGAFPSVFFFFIRWWLQESIGSHRARFKPACVRWRRAGVWVWSLPSNFHLSSTVVGLGFYVHFSRCIMVYNFDWSITVEKIEIITSIKHNQINNYPIDMVIVFYKISINNYK
jgi:hypothetical protein